MNIYGYHYKNIRPLSGTYKDDTDITVKDHRVPTVQGFDSCFVEALSGALDHSFNNYNQFWLTEKKNQQQFLDHKISTPTYPKYMSTYIKMSGHDAFLVATDTGTCQVSGVSASINNNYYFELEVVDQSNCYLRYFADNAL